MADPYLKVGEVARLLAAHPQSVFRLVQSRRIPFYKIKGIGLRFDPNEIHKWIEGQRIKGSK